MTTRWVASPPPGAGPPPRVHRVIPPYTGPPRYGPTHPMWGFPPVAKTRRRSSGADPGGRPGSVGWLVAGSNETGYDVPRSDQVRRALSTALALALATTVACWVLAAAESWRFALMLRGRTEVLPASPVRLSTITVTAAGLVTAVLAGAALLAATVALDRLNLAACARASALPARSRGSAAARMLVPGWNLFGAGQVVAEVVRALDIHEVALPHRIRRVALATWIAWVVNGVGATAVVAADVARRAVPGWAASDQVAANLVEAHIALSVVAAVTAGLAATLLGLLRNLWTGGRVANLDGWVIAPPEATPTNRRSAAAGNAAGRAEARRVGVDEPDGARTARADSADAHPIAELTPESTGVDSSASTTSAT